MAVEMVGLQDVHKATKENPLQDQSNRLNQMYGYELETDEDRQAFWQKFLQFVRESKERDMAKFRNQMV